MENIKKSPLTVLPLKWAVKRNKFNFVYINNWFVKNSLGPFWGNSECYIHYPMFNNKNIFDNIVDGYTLLSYEDFKHLVLRIDDVKKPEIGSKPLIISHLEKIKKINQSVILCLESGEKVPIEWINQYNDSIDFINR